MARIRSIKPETFTDELLGSLPRDLRLLYIGLWSMADDDGRFRAHHGLVRAAVFPYDDDLSNDRIGEWLGILDKMGRVRLYEVGGQRYGVVLRFRKHQRIEKPSKSQLPEPPKPANDQPSLPIPGTLPDRSATPPGSFPVGLEWSGREGKGMEGSGEVSAKPESKTPSPPPPTPEEIQELWNTTVHEKLPQVRELTEQRRKYLRARSRPSRDLGWWRSLFERVLDSPFLLGESDRGWRASFDFVTRSEESIVKILEGTYARGSPVNASSRAAPAAVRDPNLYPRFKPDGGA